MKKISFKNKALASLMFGFILIGSSVAYTSIASAKFIINNDKGLVTGIISDANKQNKTLTIDTVGTNPTVIQLTNDTKLKGVDAWTDLSIGDKVDVRGYQEAGVKYATSVRKINPTGYGYGNGGHAVMLNSASLIAKGATSFIVRDGFNPITFAINSDTSFVGKTYADRKSVV